MSIIYVLYCTGSASVRTSEQHSPASSNTGGKERKVPTGVSRVLLRLHWSLFFVSPWQLF